MKSSKEAQRTARKLLEATVGKDGAIDAAIVRKVVKTLNDEKPRGYLGVIEAYWRLVRLELEKNHAVIECASELGSSMMESVESDLKSKYGAQLTTEFRVNPDLLGGMRIKVGSDVWDGSVKERLARLEEKFK
ncbi:MAG: H(+)-transporting ATPase [Verrucomicrobiales bacterium]|nr:H(+)-transporting ATPase [Verrucomicrobiales bacterium]